MFLTSACGIELTNQGSRVALDQISNLEKEGFITLGAKNLMQLGNMVVPKALCSQKRNVCGMDAGIHAAFLLNPPQVFYDLANPPKPFEEVAAYEKLAAEYPILYPLENYSQQDVGVFPATLAAFWTKNLKNFKAKALGFETFEELLIIIKDELTKGWPVLIDTRVAPMGLPLFLPDEHLGIRTFWKGHWMVLVGFSEKNEHEWLLYDGYLIKIPETSLKKITDKTEIAEDLKLNISDPYLPFYLDDWNNGNNEEQLQKDLNVMKPYNIIVFEKR